MAYLKYNHGKINRVGTKPDGIILASQVIGTQSSYETPKIVRSTEELKKWFGSSYQDYEFHRALLEGGAADLLLYKPVDVTKREDLDYYIDYSGYEIDDSEIYDDPDDIPVPIDRQVFRLYNGNTEEILEYIYDPSQGFILKPDKTAQEYVYQDTIYTELPGEPDEEDKSKTTLYQVMGDTSSSVEYYIWIDELLQYYNVNHLPQNIGIADRSKSWNNRDTLALYPVDPGYSPIYASHPRYSEGDARTDIVSRVNPVEVRLSYQAKKVEDSQTWTYAFDLDFSKVTEFSESSYICYYTGIDHTRKMVCFSDTTVGLPSSDYVSYSNRRIIGTNGRSKAAIVTDIWKALLGDGLMKADTEVDQSGNFVHLSDTMFSSDTMPVDCFYRFPGYTETPNYRVSWDIIDGSIKTRSDYRVLFTSKTIGLHEDNIQVTIQKLQEKNMYQVVVSRGGVGEEVHVGTLYQDTSVKTDRDKFIEYIVNRDSELVRMKINPYRTLSTGKKKRWSDYQVYEEITVPKDLEAGKIYFNTLDGQYYQGDPDGEITVLPCPDLPQGTWELKGAITEGQTTEGYHKALDCLLESEIREDFLLVPRMSEYRLEYNLDGLSWYPEYEILLDYCKSKNAQALISNNGIGTEVSELPGRLIEGWVYKVKQGDSYDYYRVSNGIPVKQVGNREYCNPWLNEFIWNYVRTTDDLKNPKDLDRDNYLVYFYGRVAVGSMAWPGYYPFLVNILTNNHVMGLTEIRYISPIEDPLDYQDTSDLQIETALEHKKSNYLVHGNRGYYYKKYMNHTGDNKYNITIMTKFFQSRLSRIFYRNKGGLLGLGTLSELTEAIEGLLNTFTNTFYLVSYVYLNDYSIDYLTNSAKFEVTLGTKELVDKDIKLNITLNYIF